MDAAIIFSFDPNSQATLKIMDLVVKYDMPLVIGAGRAKVRRDNLVRTMLAAMSNVSKDKLEGGRLTDKEWKVLKCVAVRLSKSKIFFSDCSRIKMPKVPKIKR